MLSLSAQGAQVLSKRTEKESGTAHRLRQLGAGSLADHELLALVLGAAGPRSALVTGLLALEAAGGLSALGRLGPEELAGLPGLGRATATRLAAAVELGRRMASATPSPAEPIRSSTAVAAWFRGRLQDDRREGLHALLLDGQHRPLAHLCLLRGGVDWCRVDPGVVLAACLRRGAPALILVHNHPSGDPAPSGEDLRLTERMVRAAALVGIRIVDHLIVGRQGSYSMAEAGLL